MFTIKTGRKDIHYGMLHSLMDARWTDNVVESMRFADITFIIATVLEATTEQKLSVCPTGATHVTQAPATYSDTDDGDDESYSLGADPDSW